MSRGLRESCREWMPDTYDRCGGDAAFILWGKLFPPEALGPRCYDHAISHIGDMSGGRISDRELAEYAVYDLRRVHRLQSELAVVEHASQGNANAHMATHAELQRLRADYRTLWGMTLGHDGQPPEAGTADDVERLRARLTDLNGETQ